MAQGTGGDIDAGQFVGDVAAKIGAVLVVRQGCGAGSVTILESTENFR